MSVVNDATAPTPLKETTSAGDVASAPPIPPVNGEAEIASAIKDEDEAKKRKHDGETEEERAERKRRKKEKKEKKEKRKSKGDQKIEEEDGE